MKEIFRYLSLIAAIYVIATAVSIKSQVLSTSEISTQSVTSYQLFVTDDDNDASEFDLSTPVLITFFPLVQDESRQSITSLKRDKITASERQFIRLRNLRI